VICLFLANFGIAQVNTNYSVYNGVAGENPFFDASSNFDLFNDPSSKGKGLLFPRVDLTSWTFITGLLDGITFPSFFDGMIVYNSGIGMTPNSQIPTQTNVYPGFYYFSNPNGADNFNTNFDPDQALDLGRWIRLPDNLDLLSRTVSVSAAPPTPADVNVVYFDTDDKKFYICTAVAPADTWEAVSTGGAGSVTVANSAPQTGSMGDMYFNSDDGQLYVSTTNSPTWVAVSDPPLTFGTGLTRSGTTITSNLSVGVPGGQSAIGGTGSGDDLTLRSTSDATKGNIFFGSSTYDEVNNRLGIGTLTPTETLDVVGDIVASGDVTVGSGDLTLAGTTTTSVTIKAPDNLSDSYSLTLPPDYGTDGQVLKTDGEGNLVWTAPSGAIGSGTDTPTYEASSGTLYYETDSKELWVSDGATWQLLSGSTALVAGNLYAGEVSGVPAFNILLWSNISVAGNKKESDITSIPEAVAICTLSASNYVWLAFPNAWGSQDFFYQYGAELYPIFDGVEKRVIADDNGTDYQVWLFKTKSTEGFTVSLVVK